jgi:fibronectin-binding autotransporter adhesin
MDKLRRVLTALVLVIAPVFAPLLASVQTAHAAVDTCTWTGATNANWATATNWTGCDNGTVPENGDSLVFPQSASNKAMNNDDVGLQPQFITISGTGYTFGGNSITLLGATNGITASESATMNIGITFSGTNTNSSASAGKVLTFAQPVVLSLSSGWFWTGGGNAVFNGAVTGTAGGTIKASGAGTMISMNSTGNTYTATRAGADTDAVFDCNSTTCFGNAANIIYAGGGVVNLRVAATYANNIETSAVVPTDSWLKAYDNVTLSGTTTITDSLGVAEFGTGSKTLTLTNTMNIAAGLSVSFFGNASATSTIAMSGNLTGSTGTVSVAGVFLRLSGINTYGGVTTVNADGLVSAESATALGAAGGATSVLTGGAVVFNAAAPVTNTEPFNIAGTGIGSKGVLYALANNVTKLNGTINLTADSLIAQRSTVCTGIPTLQLNGLISGTGNLTTQVVQNACLLSIGDTSVVPGANTFSGKLTHIGGFLDLDKNLAAPHDVVLAPADPTISTIITLNGPGTNNIGGVLSTTSDNNVNDYWRMLNSETFQQLSSTTGLSGFYLCQGQTTTLDQSTDTTFNGQFGLAAGCSGVDPVFVKQGTGLLNLTRDKITGSMTLMVTAGSLAINANFSDANFTVNGGTLKGAGVLGTVTGLAGHYAPGNSPGCTTAASLALSSGFNYDEEIGGTTVCTGYDRTTVTGAAALGNATLNVISSGGFAPALGNSFTIIQAGSVSGTFNGLANGATFTANGTLYRINYTATTVTLTAVSAPLALANTGMPILVSSLFATTLVAASLYVALSKKRAPHSRDR